MKIADCKVGMKVTSAANDFGLVYEIDEVGKRKVKLHIVPIEQVMRGGVWVDNVYSYTCFPGILKEHT